MILEMPATPFVKGVPLLLICTWWMMSKVGQSSIESLFGPLVPESYRRSRVRVKYLISYGDLLGCLISLSCLGSETIDGGITPLENSDNATRISKRAAREFSCW